jgi:phage-related minor tail protein
MLQLKSLFSDLQAQYENLIEDLKAKESRLKYLSSYFENVNQKVNAAKNGIEDCKKKLKEHEDRSYLISFKFFIRLKLIFCSFSKSFASINI